MTGTTATDTVVLDSTGWLEYLTSDEKAAAFAPYLEGDVSILIPTIVLYEVRKILLMKQGKTQADIFLSEAFKRIIVPLSEDIAIKAAELSSSRKLPMADAIIYATALHFQVQVITSDPHFADLPDVVVL